MSDKVAEYHQVHQYSKRDQGKQIWPVTAPLVGGPKDQSAKEVGNEIAYLFNLISL